MTHEFTEIVLPYKAADLQRWRSGDKFLVPPFHEVHDIVINQPAYHFGEFFTMNHFHEKEGWKGYRFYALSVAADLNHPRYAPGGRKLRELIPAQRIERFHQTRAADERESRFAKGEPDLFLYKDDTREVMFVETKMKADKPDRERFQLRCLAQIRSILGCEAGIVYLREEGQRYVAKTHRIDL